MTSEEKNIPNEEKSKGEEFKFQKKAQAIINDEFIDMSFIENFKPEKIQGGNIIKYLEKPGFTRENFEKYPKIGGRARIRYEIRRINGELIDKKRNRNEERKFKVMKDDIMYKGYLLENFIDKIFLI